MGHQWEAVEPGISVQSTAKYFRTLAPMSGPFVQKTGYIPGTAFIKCSSLCQKRITDSIVEGAEAVQGLR
jgi:hypothetical protein